MQTNDPDRRAQRPARRVEDRDLERRVRNVEVDVELLLAREREKAVMDGDHEARLRQVEQFISEVKGSLRFLNALVAFVGLSGILAIITLIVKTN